jgi:hypothetical protein
VNRSDIPVVIKTAEAATKLLDRHGTQLWKATHDWQSPLRSGGAAGCKGDHADPTPQQVIAPDPMALEHAELVAELEAFWTAAANLGVRIQRLAPIDPNSVNRGRVNLVPSCIVCGGPAIPIRRGMCPKDHQAWLRADKPDLEGFKRQRQREEAEAREKRHEHEVA